MRELEMMLEKLSSISSRPMAQLLLIVLSLQLWPTSSSMGDDEFMSCDRFLGARRARLLDDIPCDMTSVSFCSSKGANYPEKAMWNFKEENRALMRRLYGDMESSVLFREMRGLTQDLMDPKPSPISSLQYKIRVGSGLFDKRRSEGDFVARRKVVRLRRKTSTTTTTTTPHAPDLSHGVHLEDNDDNDQDENNHDDHSADDNFEHNEKNNDNDNNDNNDDDVSTTSTSPHVEATTLVNEVELVNLVPALYSDEFVTESPSRSSSPTSSTARSAKTTSHSTTIATSSSPSSSTTTTTTTTTTTKTTSTTRTSRKTTRTTTTTTTMTTSTTTKRSSLDLASIPAFPTAEKVDIEEALQRILSEVNLHNLEKIVSDLLPLTPVTVEESKLDDTKASPLIDSHNKDDSDEVYVEQKDLENNQDKVIVNENDYNSEDDDDHLDHHHVELDLEQQEDFDFSGPAVSACPVSTEVVAPYWANNTRNQVLALLNIYPFEQYIHMETCENEHEQMRCDRGCRCEQQYRLHRLLAFDPNNECRGIFSDWFKFPSFCICKCYGLKERLAAPTRARRKPRGPRATDRQLDVESNVIDDDEFRRDDDNDNDLTTNEDDNDKMSVSHFLYGPGSRSNEHSGPHADATVIPR